MNKLNAFCSMQCSIKQICYIYKFFSHPQFLRRIIMGGQLVPFWEVDSTPNWFSVIFNYSRNHIASNLVHLAKTKCSGTDFERLLSALKCHFILNLRVIHSEGLWYWKKYKYLTVLLITFPAYISFLDYILYRQPFSPSLCVSQPNTITSLDHISMLPFFFFLRFSRWPYIMYVITILFNISPIWQYHRSGP